MEMEMEMEMKEEGLFHPGFSTYPEVNIG